MDTSTQEPTIQKDFKYFYGKGILDKITNKSPKRFDKTRIINLVCLTPFDLNCVIKYLSTVVDAVDKDVFENSDCPKSYVVLKEKMLGQPPKFIKEYI